MVLHGGTLTWDPQTRQALQVALLLTLLLLVSSEP